MSLLSRIKNMINICKSTSFKNGNWQVTLLDGETINNVPYAQPFGLKTQPPTGSNGVLLSRGGQKSGGFLIVLEDDSGAPELSEGESAVFNNHGAQIHLKADGSVEVLGGDMNIEDGVLKIAGTQVVGQQLPLIVPPAGGSVIDVEARAAIASIITTLQTHGLTL